jgi:hypothetical protein
MNNLNQTVHDSDPVKRRMDRFISIQSSDRPRRLPYDTDFEIPIDIIGEPQGYLVSVMSITLRNGVYPINDLNQAFYVNESGTDVQRLIPENNYNGIQFATAITAALNGTDGLNPAILAGTYTVTFDLQSERLSWASTVPFTLVAIPTGTEYYDVYDEMGLNRLDLPEATSSFTSGGPVSLNGTDKVFVTSTLGGNYITSKDARRILAEVPIDAAFNGIVHYNPPILFETWVSSTHIQDIAIQLWDSKMRLWKLPSNCHWSMTLRIRQTPPTHRIGNMDERVDGYRPRYNMAREENFKRSRVNKSFMY